jgi:hypothetical protein
MDYIKPFVTHPVACLIEGFSAGVGLGWYACKINMNAQQAEIIRENQ